MSAATASATTTAADVTGVAFPAALMVCLAYISPAIACPA